MSYRQDKRFIVAILLVAIIAVGATYAVMSSSMTGTTPTTNASTSTATSAKSGGTIVVEEPCCIDSLDPAVATSSQGGEADEAVYQGLLAYVPNSSQIVPLLAESYNVSTDGLTYTFQLRQGVTFSNGDPVNSYVFWYSMYRAVIMNQFGSYLVTVAMNATGVTASMVNQYTAVIPPQSLIQIMQTPTNAIVAPDPYTLILHLAHPFAAFLATLTQSNAFAVDPVVVSANGGVVAGQTNNWMSSNAVGNGPFMVEQYQPNNQLSLARNPKYWGGVSDVQPTPRIDRLIIRYVPNALTRVEDVQRESAQIAYVDPTLVAQAVSAGGLYVPNIGPMPVVNVFAFDTHKFPFNNTLVREAVVHAVNYTAALQEFHGFGMSFVGPDPIGTVGYNSNLQPYSYNLTLARQLLAQAGYPDGLGIPTVIISAATDTPPGPDVAVIIQSNLAEIGIKSKILTEPTSSLVQLITSTSLGSSAYPDLIYDTWFWFPDPWAFANWFVGPVGYGSTNPGDYNNTVVNNLLDKADATINETARAAIYQQIAQIVYVDAGYMWIAQGRNMYTSGVPIVSTSVAGYVSDVGFWETDFTHLYLTS
jgi:peptide/nickel transport system substrate-binding protein